MAKLGKRLKNASKLVQEETRYSLDQALDLLTSYSKAGKAKFDESVDVAIKLGIDPKQSDQMVRGAVAMPNGLGKSVRVAVFTSAEKLKIAKEAGADVFASEENLEEVAAKLDFDVCIATPDMMPRLSKLGKVLGPKGLMPNPKLGTVTEDIARAVKAAKAGQVEYKSEKAGIIHAAVGKLSFDSKALKENLLALYKAVLNAKPSGAKGTYVRDFYMSTSQGLSIRLDVDKILG